MLTVDDARAIQRYAWAIRYVSPASFSQGFDDITVLPGQGWFFQNNSSPLGPTDCYPGV